MGGSKLRRLIGAFLILWAATGGFAEESGEGSAAAVAILRAQGIDRPTAEALAKAALEAEQSGDVSGLIEFFGSESASTVFYAASLAVMMDPERAVALIRERAEAGGRAVAPLLMALAFDYSKETANYLVGQLANDDAERVAAAMFALSVLNSADVRKRRGLA